jgi:hypothetical protein
MFDLLFQNFFLLTCLLLIKFLIFNSHSLKKLIELSCRLTWFSDYILTYPYFLTVIHIELLTLL